MDNKLELFDKDGNELSLYDVISKLPPITLLENTNRVEVIDENGRSYVNWTPTNKTEISFQDGNRTLKVFINKF